MYIEILLRTKEWIYLDRINSPGSMTKTLELEKEWEKQTSERPEKHTEDKSPYGSSGTNRFI